MVHQLQVRYADTLDEKCGHGQGHHTAMMIQIPNSYLYLISTHLFETFPHMAKWTYVEVDSRIEENIGLGAVVAVLYMYKYNNNAVGNNQNYIILSKLGFIEIFLFCIVGKTCKWSQ